MTQGGLFRNFEYGVKISDAALVHKIRADVAEYGALGTRIDQQALKLLSAMAFDLNRVRAQVEKSIKAHLRREFGKRLIDFETEIIRTRAAGRAPHAIFADAIVYLLARRPMATRELHALIQRVHPDLCDDAVDRVIDGRHFGKKWKHAVRTAQQHLKKAGKIELREGLWHLMRA